MLYSGSFKLVWFCTNAKTESHFCPKCTRSQQDLPLTGTNTLACIMHGLPMAIQLAFPTMHIVCKVTWMAVAREPVVEIKF